MITTLDYGYALFIQNIKYLELKIEGPFSIILLFLIQN